MPSSFTNQGKLYYILEKTISSRSTGVECFQLSMKVSEELCIPSSCINSSSVVHISSRTCHNSIQTSHSSGTMLDGGSLDFHSSQHVERCSLLLSHHRRSHHGCFSRHDAQGSAIAALNPWLLCGDLCCVEKGSLP